MAPEYTPDPIQLFYMINFLMRRISFIIVLLLLVHITYGQTPVGSWSDHLIYNTTNCVAVSSAEVYASTGSSIIVYNKEFAELKKMSRIHGLTETGIGTISWSEENKTLIIVYTSTNVDLLKDNIIYNIPDINRKYIPGKKVINRIRTKGKYAYLACSFGIVVVDLIKKEIFDTWKPGTATENPEVWDVTFGNNKIYAATGTGVFAADLSNPGLSYYGSWNLIDILPYPNGKYTSLIFSGNRLYVNLTSPFSSGDSVYVIDGESSLFSFEQGVFNTSFDQATTGFTISSPASIRYYNNTGLLQKTISSYGYGWGSPNISQAIADNGDIWIADINSGLVLGEKHVGFFSTYSPRTSFK